MSVKTCSPRSAPIASAVRMVSWQDWFPIETATISVTLAASLRRTAASTAISSNGFIDILTLDVSTPVPSGLTRTLTLKSITRLTATSAFMRRKSAVDRQRGAVLHLFEGEAGLDAGDARHASQVLDQKTLISREIGDDDAQQIIRVAGHEIAFHHLGPFQDHRLETFERLLHLTFERDIDEDADRQPDRGRVEQSQVAAYDARRFQFAHAPQTGRRAEADLVGKLDIGETRILLQQGQDFAINGVERNLAQFFTQNTLSIASIARNINISLASSQ